MPVTVGDQLGRILGAPPGSIVMHQNVTVAEAVVLSCFRLDGAAEPDRLRGGELPVGALPLPGAAGPRGRRRRGRRCDRRRDRRADAARPDQPRPVQERARSRTSSRSSAAHARSARTWSSTATSRPGVVPFDLTELGVDFAVGGSVKWLCGGPGAGWLYVRPDLAERLEPTLVGWQGHARPFAFEPELEYAAGARRFLTGHAERPALFAATAGYDVIEEVGVARDPRALARAHAAPDRALRRGRARGRLAARARAARRHGHGLDAGPRCRATRSSASAGSSATSAPTAGGIRLGPHFFNTEDEVGYAVSELGGHRRDRRVRAACGRGCPF